MCTIYLNYLNKEKQIIYLDKSKQALLIVFKLRTYLTGILWYCNKLIIYVAIYTKIIVFN